MLAEQSEIQILIQALSLISQHQTLKEAFKKQIGHVTSSVLSNDSS